LSTKLNVSTRTDFDGSVSSVQFVQPQDAEAALPEGSVSCLLGVVIEEEGF